MKIGDKVVVIELSENDGDVEAGLQIGDQGIIEEVFQKYDNVVFVRFERELDQYSTNYRADGTYEMFKYQLEKVVEE